MAEPTFSLVSKLDWVLFKFLMFLVGNYTELVLLLEDHYGGNQLGEA